MNTDTLYLIRSDFHHDAKGPYYCPGCVEMLGLLTAYPSLEKHVQVQYVDFQRPRPALVDSIGDENQGCPVLILATPPSADLPPHLNVQHAQGHAFVEGTRDIGLYLAHTHGIGMPF